MNYVELIITTDIKIDRDQFKTSTLNTAAAIFLKIDNICKINHETVSDLQYNKSQNTLNYVNSKLFLVNSKIFSIDIYYYSIFTLISLK